MDRMLVHNFHRNLLIDIYLIHIEFYIDIEEIFTTGVTMGSVNGRPRNNSLLRYV